MVREIDEPRESERRFRCPRAAVRLGEKKLATVLSRTGLSRSTIYRKMAEGTFPAQMKISANGTGWHESDINRWVADPARWKPEEEAGDGR